MDSNPLKQPFKSGAVQAKLKSMIRITMRVIRIPIPISSAWWRWFESLTIRFESLFQRMQTEKSEGSDSNHCESDLNPNSNKFVWRPRFESLFNGFESEFLKGSKWLLDESDLNPYSMDSNPNSSKGCLDGLIWISWMEIRIPGE